MKTILSILFLLFSTTFVINAQNLIAVQNGGEPTFYQQVDDAILNAQDGDTIYIPGGAWYIYQPINKRLHLVGVGHNPNDTGATFSTTLSNVTLADGASNGSITGIFIEQGFSAFDATVNSYTVTRCRISGNLSFSNTNNNFMFIENILEGQINSGNGSATEYSFLNNIICSTYYSNTGIPFFINSIFKNNIFFQEPYFQYSLFENNVFINTGGFSSPINSTAKNNLFVATNLYLEGSTNVGSNNIVGQEQSTIFVNQEGYTFNYAHDYHLQPNSPGKNAGTDGTDVGIYGGIYPWKEGSIPFNPHFETIQISPTTDENGNLNVNIKVAAQER